MSFSSLRILLPVLIAVACAVAPVAFAHAEEAKAPAPASTAPAASGGGVLALLPADAISEHTLRLGEETLAYTATAGTFALYDQSGERAAAIFYTAYVRKGPPAPARPVTFVFNGGPGAASAYLHLGLAGPRVMDAGPTHDGAAARLLPNPDTWLRFTDLVFIDPVGAGWSRAAKAGKEKDFWSVEADASAFAKTIALYLARNGRLDAPKYLAGESYGGFRAAKLARALQREQGIFVAGVVMISPFLDGSLGADPHGSALAAALRLPSYAASALDAAGRYTPEALADAERFAMTEYLVTLAGKPPDGEAARAFYARVAALAGMPVELVARGRGFIRGYTKHARAAQGEVVSAYDGALAMPDPYPETLADRHADPVLSGFTRVLASLFAAYARDDLGFRTDMTYTLLGGETATRWDWGHGGRAGASVAGDLRELLALGPRFAVLVAHGRSDLVTPYGVTRYILDHLPPIGEAGRTSLKLYKGGHMFYFDPAVRAAFSRDVAAFYRGSGS